MREGEKKSTENRQEEEEEMSKVNCLFDETGSGKGKIKILKYLLLHLLDYSTYNLRWKRSVRLKRGTMTDRDQYRTAVAHAECTRSPILDSPFLIFLRLLLLGRIFPSFLLPFTTSS